MKRTGRCEDVAEVVSTWVGGYSHAEVLSVPASTGMSKVVATESIKSMMRLAYWVKLGVWFEDDFAIRELKL